MSRSDPNPAAMFGQESTRHELRRNGADASGSVALAPAIAHLFEQPNDAIAPLGVLRVAELYDAPILGHFVECG